jgi:hypothetical protein
VTGIYYHAQLSFCWDGVSQTYFAQIGLEPRSSLSQPFT